MRLVVTNQRNYLKEKYTKANALKVARMVLKVTRMFLRVLKTVGIVFLILIGLVLLTLLIGFIADLAVTPQWAKAQSASSAYFTSLKGHRFLSPSLEFTSLDSNAWFYYQKAGDMLHSMPMKDREVIAPYGNEADSFSFSKAESVVMKCDKEVALFDSGVSCSYCAIPLEYEKGSEMSLIPVYRQEFLSKFSILKGRLELTHGNPRKAAATYAKVLKMGTDIAGGGVDLYNSLIGRLIGGKALTQIAIDLNDFDLPSTTFLKDAVDSLEGHWPSLYPAIRSRGFSFILPSYAGWDGSNNLGFYYCLEIPPPRSMMDENGKPTKFVRLYLRSVLSLMSWEYLFSVRTNTMNGAQRFIVFANQWNDHKKDGWISLYPLIVKADKDYERESKYSFIVIPYRSRYQMFSLALYGAWIPFSPIYYQDQYRGYFRHLMLMRVTKVALALREYKLKNNKYPESIDEFLSSNPDFYDLANNKSLRYIRNPANKSIRLYSIGLNLKDDRGESERDAFQWKQAKDDIGVDLR